MDSVEDERTNAEGELRRTELVQPGGMTERDFVEIVRVRLTGQALTRDYSTRWRLADDPGRR